MEQPSDGGQSANLSGLQGLRIGQAVHDRPIPREEPLQSRYPGSLKQVGRYFLPR